MIRSFLNFFRLEYIRHFLTLFSSSVLGQLLTLALAPVLSRIYSPEDFGLAALYLAFLGVLAVISTGKYEQAIMLPRDERAAIHIFRLVLLLAFVMSTFFAIVITLFNSSITSLFGNPALSAWLYLLPISLLFNAAQQASIYYSNRTKQFGRIAKTTLIQHTSTNMVKLGAGLFQKSLNGLIIGQMAGHFLSVVFVLQRTMKQIRKINLDYSWLAIKKEAAIYAHYPRFNMLLSLTNNLSGSLPIFIFTWGFSPEVAGLYAFAYAFVFRPLSMFSQSTQQVLSQKMIERHHQGLTIYPIIMKMVKRFFLIGIIPFFLATIWAPEIFGFLFSETYRPSGQYLQILSPWLFMVYLTSPLTFLHELLFRQKTAMYIDMVYLAMRFLALMTGIWLKDIVVGLILYAAVSALVVGYKLFWYLQLAKEGDNKLPNQ